LAKNNIPPAFNASRPDKPLQPSSDRQSFLTNYYCIFNHEVIFTGDNPYQIRVSGKNTWKGEYEAQCRFIATAAWIAAVGIKEWPALMMAPLFASGVGA
jgi:hypothetical protein